MPKFETKSTLFVNFLGRQFKKTIVMFKISTLAFVKNKFLTGTVNFGIWSESGSALFSMP